MSVRLVRRTMRGNTTLRKLTSDMHDDDDDDEKSIDFSSVGLYLAGLQVVFTLVCCAAVSVLSCWVLGPESISAVRTLAITTTAGALMLRRPLRVGRTRGVTTVFNALRPCLATYILALVLEQLVHTCVVVDTDAEGQATLRRAVYHVVSLGLLVSGFARAKNPRSESDLPFLVTVACLLATALLPPPAIDKTGPLCEPTTLLGAGERVLRALLFSTVYTVLVYAAAPSQNVSNELFICVARATAASVWVLGASWVVLPLAPLQVGVVLFSRLNDGEPSDAPIRYENVPLHSGATPLEGSDAEGGDIECAVNDADSIRLALAKSKALSAPTNGVVVGPGASLSFDFGASTPLPTNVSGLPQAAVAAAVAREAGDEA